jgi:hypothetical protein
MVQSTTYIVSIGEAMNKFFKHFFCRHSQVRVVPRIEVTLRDLFSYTPVDVFNEVEWHCVVCDDEGRLTMPVILTSKTPGTLASRIIESYLARETGAKDVKIV